MSLALRLRALCCSRVSNRNTRYNRAKLKETSRRRRVGSHRVCVIICIAECWFVGIRNREPRSFPSVTLHFEQRRLTSRYGSSTPIQFTHDTRHLQGFQFFPVFTFKTWGVWTERMQWCFLLLLRAAKSARGYQAGIFSRQAMIPPKLQSSPTSNEI